MTSCARRIGKTTVTAVATGHGFWEFGCFATTYKARFNQSPSVTLRTHYDAAPADRRFHPFVVPKFT